MSYVEVETGRLVKRWAFWNPATWSIPKLYWDAWSQEQRIHAICRQLEKVIKYADYLGVNTDNIAVRLKAIEEGQLDPWIIENIEKWFEENEPFIVQDINALNAALPISEFDSDNTIKDALDNADAALQQLGAVLPVSDFSTENTVKDAIDELDSRIDAIDNTIYDYFKGKNAVIIGDSYSYGTGASDHLAGDTKRFSSILCTRLEATEYNFAVGSTGFCDPGSSGQNAPFKTQVTTAYNSMTAKQRANTALVLISGGLNDWREGATYSAANMKAGAQDAVANARTDFPNALILVVPMLFNGHGADPRMFHFENSIISGVIGHKRATYIRGAWSWNFGRASYFANDELHPNDAGHKNIADMIYASILGGYAYENLLGTITFDEGFTSSTAYGGYFQFENGIVQSMGTYVNTENSISSGTLIKIGNVPGSCVPLMNVAVPITQSNAQVGIAIITTGGNLYIKATDTIGATGFYISSFSFMPSGLLL